MFPSLTEGRGLPIPESAAAGVPIICSEYDPPAVFSEVVGLDRPANERLRYFDFPEGGFSEELLADITAALLDPSSQTEAIEHNRRAVRARYSLDALTASFEKILDRLDQAVGSA